MLSQINLPQLDHEGFLLKLNSILSPPEVAKGSARFYGGLLRSGDDSTIRGSQCIGVRKRDDDDEVGRRMKRVPTYRNATWSSSGSYRWESTSPWASSTAPPSVDTRAYYQQPPLQALGDDVEEDYPMVDTDTETHGDPEPIGVDHLTSIMHLTLQEISDNFLLLNDEITQLHGSQQVGRRWEVCAQKAQAELSAAKHESAILRDRLDIAGAEAADAR